MSLFDIVTQNISDMNLTQDLFNNMIMEMFPNSFQILFMNSKERWLHLNFTL